MEAVNKRRFRTVDEEKSFKLYQFLHIPASVFEFFCNRDKIV